MLQVHDMHWITFQELLYFELKIYQKCAFDILHQNVQNI